MQCELTQGELVAFYFGDVDERERARVEAHLREHPACVDAYLALKRSIEAGELKPSKQARDRLRDAVARELSSTEPAAWLWWERPLAFAFATVTVALALITVGQL